jgi:hypothetical protein
MKRSKPHDCGAPLHCCDLMGNLCRYEGATAAAASDSIMVNQGGKRGRRGTVIANSMMTGSTSALPAASRRGSFGTTSQPVSAMALSGNPNGRIQIAQVRLFASSPWRPRVC